MLRLIDVSGNQGSAISWPAVAQAGVAGAFCKVVEGAGWFDETAPYNAAEIKAVGLVRGYYAFARPDLGNTPQQEAQYFLDHIPDLAPGDLLALDLEMPTSGPGEFDQFALSWLQFVEREVGVRPLVYTGRWYAAGLRRLTAPALGQYHLWDAAYTPVEPPAYAPWSAITIWQHTNQALYPGIGRVDESFFGGSVHDLKALGLPAPPKPAPPPPSLPHWKVVTPTHFRPRPQLDAMPLGPLLPAGTFVAEVPPPPGLPRVTGHWKYVRTGGDVRGYIYAPDLVADVKRP